jgi:hypothetical protein
VAISFARSKDMVNFDLNRTFAAVEIEPLIVYREKVTKLKTIAATDGMILIDQVSVEVIVSVSLDYLS